MLNCRLANTYAEQNKIEFSKELLTPERLQEFMSYLSFKKVDGKFDIFINGLGLDYKVYAQCPLKMFLCRYFKIFQYIHAL